ncbi:ATPase [Mycobacterium colombiense]|uniref:ATPase n=2 Tax=Mycobacterium colombiense TaxID=339268 RepID=A0A853M2J2_9MYCO|nr:ATPase [Mycobacterium colombiense]OBJ18766.1 ATPase [Mycobacterium colombiense]OBJ41134.1 ATPase [Mycobacterium colombiense]OBJ46382.1 ATPase [Mycobacterium colombiense]OBJ61986.1 ATPase [Mycobacterium colombiense]
MTSSVAAEFRWRASGLTRAIATCAGFAMAAAVIGARWQLIAFAAPLLGVLCSISWQRAVPTIHVHGEPDAQRCFETEQARVRVWVTQQGASAVQVTIPDIAGMELEIPESGAGQEKTVTATARRWGRYSIDARIDVVARGGLLTGTATVGAAEVIVFPLTPPQPTPIPQTELLDRLGAHLTRHIGPGVEYADIRLYVPGDQLRAVNWPVSARRGQLHVTQRLTDRAADVVVLIDGYRQPAGPATEATERVVRGAAQVVQTALRHGDRAGIVALGGNHPRWLGADIGQRQFYRVLDTVLNAGDRFEHTTGTLAPRAAVPAGAIVIAFSTLLDTEFALALINLRKRGHVVLAVDILDSSPFEDEQDPLVDRMWALQRSAMYRDMATIGVDIVSWRGDSGLEQSMGVMPDRRRRVRGRLRG